VTGVRARRRRARAGGGGRAGRGPRRRDLGRWGPPRSADNFEGDFLSA